MATVTSEGTLVSIAVAVDADTFTLHLVVDPAAGEPAATITVYNLAFTMFEAILELSSVDVSSQRPQHAIAVHFALCEVAFIDISILELKTPWSIIICRNYRMH